MFARFFSAALLAAALAVPALAAPYWVAWDGDGFPENQGWERVYGNEDGPHEGGAARTIHEGVMTIDSLRSNQIYDFYELDRPIDLDPGELFVAEWRVRIAANEGNPGAADSGVVIAPDGGGTLGLSYVVDRIVSDREGWTEPIAPFEFHAYRIESTDMVTYSLWIDGIFTRNGTWDLFSLNTSFVAFGDGVQGARSFADWDHVRFGVVPEPASFVMFVLATLLTSRCRHLLVPSQCWGVGA